MAVRVCSWVVALKLWLVVGEHGWWQRNYSWSWVVVGGGGKIMANRGWSWWWWQNYGWSWVNMGGGSEIIAGPGWSWEVAAKLWLIVGGHGSGSKIMANRLCSWWWRQNYGWSRVVMGAPEYFERNPCGIYLSGESFKHVSWTPSVTKMIKLLFQINQLILIHFDFFG